MYEYHNYESYQKNFHDFKTYWEHTFKHDGGVPNNLLSETSYSSVTSNLCDTDDTVFSDLVPGCQSLIHPPTTTTDIMNEKGLQCTREYLLSHPVTPSDQ